MFKYLSFIVILFCGSHFYSQPPNDNCANAISLTFTGNTATVAATTANATYDFDFGCNGWGNPRNIWYKFVAIGHDYVITVTPGTLTYAAWAIYTMPTACTANGYLMDCRASGTSGGIASQTRTCYLSRGRTYYIWVGDDHGSMGTFTLSVTNTSPGTTSGDDIYFANSINSCGSSFNGSTVGATNCGDANSLGADLDNNTTTDPFGWGDGSDVNFTVENSSWYSFCNAVAGTYTINFSNTGSCTGSNGLQIAIFTGSPTNLTLKAGGANGMNILSGASWSSGTLNFSAGQCVYVLVDGYGGTNCNYALNVIPASTCAILPVEIIDFNVSLTDQNTAMLNWRVGSEENIKKYKVQQSTDGINFTTIGEVISHNTFNSQYYFEDKELEKGITYYRLISVEDDYTEKIYPSILALNFEKTNLFLLSPNPVTDELFIEVSEDKEIVSKIELFNSNGVKMKTFDRLTINEAKIRIETGDLQSGMYFIQIECNGIINSQKFIIVD